MRFIRVEEPKFRTVATRASRETLDGSRKTHAPFNNDEILGRAVAPHSRRTAPAGPRHVPPVLQVRLAQRQDRVQVQVHVRARQPHGHPRARRPCRPDVRARRQVANLRGRARGGVRRGLARRARVAAGVLRDALQGLERCVPDQRIRAQGAGRDRRGRRRDRRESAPATQDLRQGRLRPRVVRVAGRRRRRRRRRAPVRASGVVQ